MGGTLRCGGVRRRKHFGRDKSRPLTVKKMYFCLVACVGATIGRPPAYRRNAFSGMVFLQGKRARASNARPYKSVSTVCSCPAFPLPTVPNGCLFLPLDKSG